jgi:membrane protein
MYDSRSSRVSRLTDRAVLKEIVTNTIAHGLSNAASAMAFDLFLGVIPLMAMMGWLAGYLARTGRRVAFDLSLLDLAPGPAAELARSHLSRLDPDISTLAGIVLIGFIWLSSSGTHVALATVRGILGLPARTYVRTRLLALGLTFGGVIALGMASAAAVLIHGLGAVGAFSDREHALWKGILVSSTILIATIGCALLYRIASGRKWENRSILPGAFLASLTLHLVSWVFSTYVRTLAKYTAFYGGLAGVAVLMVWLWLSSLAVLVGAEANAVLDETRGKTPPRRSERPSLPPNAS